MQTLKPLSLALLAALSAASWADDSAVSFSGFATIGAVRTNTNDAQYRQNIGQLQGAGRAFEFEVDTKLGLQATGKLSPDFSLTAQVLTQQDEEGNYKPAVEWAFAKYAVNSDLSVRVGRVGMPVFLISDFRNVGYANVWVRPPVDVYAQVPLSTFDGADLVWRANLGDNTLTVQPYVGQTDFKLTGGTDGKFKKLAGVNTTFEIGSLLLRAGYVQGKLSIENNSTRQLFPAMRAIPVPGWSAAADALEAKSKDASFAGLGATWDDGKLLLQGEFTQRRTKSFIADTDAWYTTLGYRFGDFTPYVSHAAIKPKYDGIATSLLAPTPQLAGLKKAVVGVQLGNHQHTDTLGVRWNAYKNIAFKTQLDRVTTEAGDSNIFTVPAGKPGVAGKSVNVFSIAADFIF